jgi:drug/metabolite transporter (DMT)-like permease
MAGGVAMGAHWVTYFQSLQLSTVAIGILPLRTYPVMTAVVEPMLVREPLHGLDMLLGEIPAARTMIGGLIILAAVVVETVRVVNRPSADRPANANASEGTFSRT